MLTFPSIGVAELDAEHIFKVLLVWMRAKVAKLDEVIEGRIGQGRTRQKSISLVNEALLLSSRQNDKLIKCLSTFFNSGFYKL
jgi:hypothetical protein